MRKVPFDLEYYRRHHPMLVTKSGDSARMLDDHLKGDTETLCVAVLKGTYEVPFTYYEDGRYLKNKDTSNDLLMLIR